MKPISRTTLRLLGLAVATSLTACQTAPHRGEVAQPIQDVLADAAGQPGAAAPPPEVSAALLPPLKLDLPTAPVEQRFDITVHNAPAQEFFMGLVQGTPYNMVVHPDVSGEITLNLKSVSIPQVLEAVRDVYGYEYAVTPAGYQVMPIRMQSRIFEVNYLNVRRSGKSETRVSSGQVSETSSDDSGSSSSGTGSTTQRSNLPSSHIATDTEADFWAELRASLAAIVGNEEGRSVVVSPQSGIVVVRAMPSELRDVAAFLESSQQSLHRQVILEAKIIEVALSDGFQSGINWAALGKPGDGKSVLVGQTGGGTLFSEGSSEIGGNTGLLDPSAVSQVSNTNTSAFGGAWSAAINLKDFTAFIELLKTQGDVQVLSSPRVSTVNNQKAVIKVGSDEFFITDVSSTTTTGTTATTDQDITLTPFFSGIALDVTPQINAKGEITLHIHPVVSEVVDQTKTFTVGGSTESLPLAFSTVRESDSVVRAQSGQVVVIGGLMQNKLRKDKAGLPVLGDIPGVGHAFKHSRDRTSKSELVILLRPVVIDHAGQWQDQVRDSQQRIDGLGITPAKP